MNGPGPLRVGLVGCGAIVQSSHAPVLRTLAAAGRVAVAAVVDPDVPRREKIGRLFPGARLLAGIEELAAGEIAVAIVASPVRFHAEQTIRLLENGVHVLCEKPLAPTLAEGEAMAAAAARTGRVLAVGLFRRFFPAWEAVAEIIAARTFGALRRFEIQEGGPFNWPAATPSFFDARQAGGGVLLDAGVHVLDSLMWWLGEPAALRYADDAEGGLEATSRLELDYADGPARIQGTVLLSRDGKTSNRWTLVFERGTVVWRAGEACALEFRPDGAKHWFVSRLETDTPAGRGPAGSYPQAFTRQMLDVLDAAAQGRAPRVSADEALRSLRLIERCYRERTPLRFEAL